MMRQTAQSATCLRAQRGPRSSKSRAGFTLLEVLVAMTILTIIGAAVFTIFRQSSEMYSRTIAHTRQFLAAREALGVMASELRQARLVPAVGGLRGFWGFRDDTATAMSEVGVYFVAPTTMRDTAASHQDLCIIGYWLDDPNADDAPPYDLMRYCLTDADPNWTSLACPDSATLRSHSEKLGLLVRSLTFEYWSAGDSRWDPSNQNRQQWTTSNVLPLAVRITLVVVDPSDPNNTLKDKTFTTVVDLDNAR
jgi:prepilin-type N-terminal cleavage/methylation domain-containing protein